jgi:transglutaminase-like putative cysteine protease
MLLQKTTQIHVLIAKLIFLMLPTAFAGYYLIDHANVYYGIIGDPSSGLLKNLPMVGNMTTRLTLMFAAGMFLSGLFHFFRFRFLPAFILLTVVFWILHHRLDQMAGGEFDAFFISVQFFVFTVLFTTGWICGWLFMRVRYGAHIIAAILLATAIVLIAGEGATTTPLLLQKFIPALLLTVYLIFSAEQIHNTQERSTGKFWWLMTRRMIIFSLLTLLLAGTVIWSLKKEIDDTVAQYGGQGEAGTNSMLEKNADGSFDLKQYSRLSSSLGRSNELLFCAHINNFFPDSDIPNPLYLTAFHYTFFDTLTETFERDSLIPYNDLFEPNPSRIPLFATRTDSSVIVNSLGDKLRTIVDMELYGKSLSAETYLAPGTGFFVQPIAVEKDFRDEFKWAYRTKSYVSALNSAYFIYNSEDETIRKFQEQRFEVLRKIKNYEDAFPEFMEYYTRMPADPKFDKIKALAAAIGKDAVTPIDKVLAIRDFFLAKDEFGEPIFTYTDNPGVPDIPSASKLMYFLFENKKGYCAYYAGATLFLLRAMGIPSRITVGFLTVDRSDKNKGWYWYYADQAHAWVQVYFPGYGWLDFDTTVGNDEAQESPAPDGTPPMQPPRAWLAMEGIISNVDTVRHRAQILLKQFIFHDQEYQLPQEDSLLLDLGMATIRLDSLEIPLREMQVGDTATAVSYAEALKKLAIQKTKATVVFNKLPQPTPIDEVYLKRKKEVSDPEVIPSDTAPTTVSPARIFKQFVYVLLGLGLLLISMPLCTYLYFRIRYNFASAVSKPYYAWKTASFYLHQLGIDRQGLTPLQYASEKIDPLLQTHFHAFMVLYLQHKYDRNPLSDKTLQELNQFLPGFLRKVSSQYSIGKRIIAFLHIKRALNFWTQDA